MILIYNYFDETLLFDQLNYLTQTTFTFKYGGSRERNICSKLFHGAGMDLEEVDYEHFAQLITDIMTKGALTTNPLDYLLEGDYFIKSDALFAHLLNIIHDKIQNANNRGTVFHGKFERGNSDYNLIRISSNDSNGEKNKHRNKIKLSDVMITNIQIEERKE